MEWLAYEKEALGLYLSGHPVDRHAADLRAFGARTVGDLCWPRSRRPTTARPGRLVLDDVVGRRHRQRACARSRPRRATAMAVFTLEDHQGAVEVVVVPRDLRPLPAPHRDRRAAAGAGKFERDDESSRFQAAELSPLETLRERLAKAVSIHLQRQATSRADARGAVGRAGAAPGRPADRARGGGRAATRAGCGCAPTSPPQIRVRPSEQLVSAVERAVRRRLGCAAIDRPHG